MNVEVSGGKRNSSGCLAPLGCIQKFPDRIDNETQAYLWYYSSRSNTKGHSGKGHWTDSQSSDTTAPGSRLLYDLQFSLQVTSPETFGYTLVQHTKLR